MPEKNALLSLLVITLLAASVPLLAARLKRFHVPVVILEILSGILIGNSVLGIVTPSPVLDFLSEFGFVILMFISGLEMDLTAFSSAAPHNPKSHFWKNSPFLALATFLLTLGAAFAIASGLARGGFVRQPLIIGLILSTTSLGIVVPVLKERGVVATGYGQAILLSALLADFLTLVLLSVSLGVMTKGFVMQLLLLLVLVVVFAAMVGMGMRVRKIKPLAEFINGLTTATVQIRLRFSIALMVAWVALAQSLGMEVILGAFLAGVIMSVMAGQDKAVLQEKLDTIGFGFFIPLFFISVGTDFEFQALDSPKAFALLPILIVAAYAVKVLPALVFRTAFSWRESLAAGFLLSSRLSLIIAASTLAFKLGLISEAVNANILLLAMVTCMLSPVIFNRIAPPTTETRRKGYIVVGFNQHTALLVERLIREGEEVSVLQTLEDRCHEFYCKGATIATGDPEDERVLKALGAEKAAGLVTVLNDRRTDMAVCRLAVERFRIPVVVVSRTDDRELMREMGFLGVKVVQSSMATALALEGALRHPSVFDMITELTDGAEFGEATVADSRFEGVPVDDVRLPGNALIMGVRRGGEVIVPHGYTTLSVGDTVMLVGSPDAIRETAIAMAGG